MTQQTTTEKADAPEPLTAQEPVLSVVDEIPNDIADIARRLVSDLNNRRRSWTMHIPVQADDPDVIVYRLAKAYEQERDQLSAFRAVCRVYGVAGAAELGELLAKLPKTADGVPIVAGMILYGFIGDKIASWDVGKFSTEIDGADIVGRWCASTASHERLDKYYSTRKSALAAQGEALEKR